MWLPQEKPYRTSIGGRTILSILTATNKVAASCYNKECMQIFWQVIWQGNNIFSCKTTGTRKRYFIKWSGSSSLSSPLPCAGTPSTLPGCSRTCSTWPWPLSGMGLPQLLWQPVPGNTSLNYSEFPWITVNITCKRDLFNSMISWLASPFGSKITSSLPSQEGIMSFIS